jgi:hypothetical protein
MIDCALRSGVGISLSSSVHECLIIANQKSQSYFQETLRQNTSHQSYTLYVHKLNSVSALPHNLHISRAHNEWMIP